MVTLSEAISAYQTALENLPSQKAEDSPSKLMRVLLARDVVAQTLSNNQVRTPEALNRIVQLDQRLRASAKTVVGTIESATPTTWRESVQPPLSAWWWFLDELAAPQPDPLWAILSAILIFISLGLAAEISIRFLSNGADFLGVFGVLSQLLLILLTGSTFTKAGAEEIERVLSRLGVARQFHPQWKIGLAIALLVIVLVLKLSLPNIARYYNDQGVRDQQNGLVTSAITSYQRAISLSSDYAQAHYNLATAYEDVLEYDKALGEYQTALRADPRLYPAYNNLARLYMVSRNDFADALALLNTALEIKPDLDNAQRTQVQYSLLKNHGWANFGLKYLVLAESDLRQALTLRQDGAAAHCLLAQVLEAQSNPKAALSEWETCLRYEKSDNVEANWLGLARERLSQGGQK